MKAKNWPRDESWRQKDDPEIKDGLEMNDEGRGDQEMKDESLEMN